MTHHGSTRGALCGAPSGWLTLSTSWDMVDCKACNELADICAWCEGAGTRGDTCEDCAYCGGQGLTS
jgi:hypothetical protein